MNDPHLTPDELASAYLDGELDADESNAVLQNSDLAARASELRLAADAVAAAVTPPPDAEDTAVAAALAEFEADRAVVTKPLKRRPRRLTAITGIAAAIALGFIVAAAAGLFAERDQPTEETTDALAVAEVPQVLTVDDAKDSAVAPGADLAALAEAEETASLDADAAASYDEAATLAEETAVAESDEAPEKPEIQAAETPDEDMAFTGSSVSAPSDEEVEQAKAALAEDTASTANSPTDQSAETRCVEAIGASTVELRLSVGGTIVLVLQNPDNTLRALDAATCNEILPAR